MDPGVILYLIIIVAPFSLLLHEMGHVLGARIVKSEYIKLSIGSGKKLFNLTCLVPINISFHQWFFWGAYTKSKRKIPLNSLESAIVSGLGPIASIIVAFVFYYINNLFAHPFINVFVLFNLWVALVNIIPFKIGNKQSDGYMILKALSK
ncbi:site-2 protease family protein [Virgibacillus sp. W0181]|uniref:site-2 protease family protein n=1 Tax=Virgibacillus sp. W0181 TaxID=3391581 RepID=UPI003F474FB6